MKEIMEEYGLTMVSMMVVCLLLSLMITLPLFQGKNMPQLAGELLRIEQASRLQPEKRQAYQLYTSVENPSIICTSQAIYAGERWKYSDLFPAVDGQGKPARLEVKSIENLPGSQEVTFPKEGIYHFEVLAKDGAGRRTKGSFQLPVLHRL